MEFLRSLLKMITTGPRRDSHKPEQRISGYSRLIILLDLQDIPEVMADDKEIRQCILNLVNNAMDATAKGWYGEHQHRQSKSTDDNDGAGSRPWNAA